VPASDLVERTRLARTEARVVSTEKVHDAYQTGGASRGCLTSREQTRGYSADPLGKSLLHAVAAIGAVTSGKLVKRISDLALPSEKP